MYILYSWYEIAKILLQLWYTNRSIDFCLSYRYRYWQRFDDDRWVAKKAEYVCIELCAFCNEYEERVLVVEQRSRYWFLYVNVFSRNPRNQSDKNDVMSVRNPVQAARHSRTLSPQTGQASHRSRAKCILLQFVFTPSFCLRLLPLSYEYRDSIDRVSTFNAQL